MSAEGTSRADHPASPMERRWRVVRHAFGAEIDRLHDPRRVAAIVILAIVFAVIGAGVLARGEEAGADARAYWAAVRIWLNGGDPYHPSGPFLPYVYAPWMLPLFAPWALLPWDVAWFVWRGGILIAWLATIHWAYGRRPLATAIAVLLLAFPIGANLDTGNVTLLLALGLWVAQFSEARLAGLIWAIATWMKWVPAPFWLLLAPRARTWGLLWLALAGILSLLTLPLTIIQLQALFGFGPRPPRLDYLVLLWATVPWLWRHPVALARFDPRTWRTNLGLLRRRAGALRAGWTSDPRSAGQRARVEIRAFLGLENRGAG
ncbi:MAG TPA: glycosyltransferase family 87 protein [Candidatus Limnocylindrales bacterium]|nr:glycosyltransferase family 87 protein [Candidatus Limnocylindrales bacterium]